MKKPFFARYALFILMAVFFLTPFALRGARRAIQNMKNDVKDWLPSDFVETKELDWFRDHFLGEQFVVVSWENCTGMSDDESFMTFVDNFFPEIPPSIRQMREEAEARGEALPANLGRTENWPVEVRRREFIDPNINRYVRQLKLGDLPPEDDFVGNRFGLSYSGPQFDDWGGQQEKWLKGDGDRWFYLTPDGELFRWAGGSSILQPLISAINRRRGAELNGEYIISLGPLDGPWYYESPERLNARLFKTVMTGPGVLHDLTKDGGSLSNDPEAAMARLEGSLFGPDHEQTCLIATLTDAAKRNLRRTLGRGVLGRTQGELFSLAERSGINAPANPIMLPPPFSWFIAAEPPPPSPTLKLGGPPVDNVAIDEEGQITLARLVGLSAIVGIGLSWICFRSANVTIMLFFVGGISAVASLSFVYWGNQSVDAVLMSMPSLVYVLGLSGAVHIINYYGESVGEVGLRGAAGRAVALGWKPCTLAAITTSLGLLSLYASNILPIRKFGTFSAIGVLATLILLFTYLPSALQTWPPRRFRNRSGDKTHSHATAMERAIDWFWVKVGGFVIRHSVPVAIACLVAMIGIGYGLTRINTDVQLLKMFDQDATIIGDYRWLERHLGKLVPMEVVVKVAPDHMRSSSTSQATSQPTIEDIIPLTFLERMEISTYIQEVLDRQLGQKGEQKIGQAMLASTFAPVLPGSGGGIRKLPVRGGMNGRLEANRDRFLATDYLRVDKHDQSELWRISLRLGALDDTDYGVFVDDLKQTIEPVLMAYRYRDQILRAVAEQRGEKGIRKGRVYLVGAPFGGGAPSTRVRNDDAYADGSPAEPSPKIGQTAIFAKILGRLLLNAGLDIHDWHDPRFELPDNWDETLGQQDCVVLIDRNEHYDVEQLKKDAPRFVDARDHFYSSDGETANVQGQPIAAIYTGVVPVVYKAQRTLLVSLIESTGWAFVMIAIVMMLVVRSAPAGLLSMLPNVFPVVAVFGFMGWRNIMVDIGSMMTASVAMGVAVDDTIHFLTWFRRGLDQNLSRQNAILLAYRRVGLAMTQTTAIGGLGLSIFAFSTFTPTQRFGVLMLALLAAALVGDLIFLPALLASPLGRVFSRKSTKPARDGGAPATPETPGDVISPHVSPSDRERERTRAKG